MIWRVPLLSGVSDDGHRDQWGRHWGRRRKAPGKEPAGPPTFPLLEVDRRCSGYAAASQCDPKQTSGPTVLWLDIATALDPAAAQLRNVGVPIEWSGSLRPPPAASAKLLPRAPSGQ